jgi:hypothetical protein
MKSRVDAAESFTSITYRGENLPVVEERVKVAAK